MVDKTLSQVVGESPILKPPVTLTGRRIFSDSGSWHYNSETHFDLTKTGNSLGTAYTEVLNISGAGVITFLGMTPNSDANVSPGKLKVVIDGVTAMDESVTSLVSEAMFCAVGSAYLNSTGGAPNADFGAVPFKTSLVVSIAGDGTDRAVLWYGRYLT